MIGPICQKCKKLCRVNFAVTKGEWHSKADMDKKDYDKELKKGTKENKKSWMELEQFSNCCNSKVKYKDKEDDED